MDYSSYSLQTACNILSSLETSLTGLSIEQVAERKQLYGQNTLRETHHSLVFIFLAQFNSPMIWLLIAAAGTSLFLGDITQAGLIIVFVLINTLFSFYQEAKSDHVLQLLKKHLQLTAKVRRNNIIQTISANDLVPGDIILLEPGDFIPAEIRFIQTDGLLVDESIMTGESVPISKIDQPVEKKEQEHTPANIGMLGTMVISGTATAVVFAIGAKTELGNISNLVINVIRNNNFSQEINRLSQFILWLVLITLAIVFITHLIIHPDTTNIIELLTFSIALAVAITPETLPTVITFALTNGASKLATQQVIVKRLSAIEDLGNIDILCTDKTGTLTENKLTLVDVYSEDKEKTIIYGALVATKPITDLDGQTNSFDRAIIQTIDPSLRTTLAEYKRLYDIPFSPNRLRSSSIIQTQDTTFLVVRGALEKVIEHCQKTSTFSHSISWAIEQEKMGKRTLAVAYKTIDPKADFTQNAQNELDLVFLGLLSFEDPIKKDTYLAIKEAQKLHIIVKILTGDSPVAAQVAGQAIGLINKESINAVITGTEFDALSPEDQEHAALKYTLFARINPQQKYKIVELLKKQYRVGFLGEGFNDAPALKIADVGLVVQEATDVAREAADIILLGSGLHVIINGIKQGRLVFNNTLKYLQIVLSSNFGNFYSIAIASFFIDFLPMLPIQILLVNLLSDFPMIAIASDAVDTSELRKPKRYNLKHLAFFIIIFGLVSAPFDFALFMWFKHSPSLLQTNWFIESILTELVIITSLRTRLLFFKAKRMSHYLLTLVIISAIAAIIIPLTHLGQIMFHFVAPRYQDILLIIALGVSYLCATELIKRAYYHLIGT